MKRLNQSLFAILILAMLAACAGKVTLTSTPGAVQPQPAVVEISAKSRITDPGATPAGLSQLAEGNTAFAFDLYQQLLSAGDGNLFYSPYSVSVALSMVRAGAKGQTLSQMDQVMHYTLEGAALYQAFDALQLALSAEQKSQIKSGENDFTLNVANATWGQSGYKFLPDYLDILAGYYGAGMRLIDFQADPEAARLAINDWVAGQTAQKILDLVPRGMIDPTTHLVLTNAIYFNSPWAMPFSESATQDAPFTNLDGAQVSVPTMNVTSSYSYFQGDGYQAVALPYLGDKLSMLVLLPDAGHFARVEKSLNPALLETVRQGLKSELVRLSLPKFQYETGLPLGDTLRKMGMVAVFYPSQADLSGMDGTRSLFIAEVVHKAYVSVDEKGTEAAAATAVAVPAGALAGDLIPLKVDRPFIFLIQDNQSGTLLFVGRVVGLG